MFYKDFKELTTYKNIEKSRRYRHYL